MQKSQKSGCPPFSLNLSCSPTFILSFVFATRYFGPLSVTLYYARLRAIRRYNKQPGAVNGDSRASVGYAGRNRHLVRHLYDPEMVCAFTSSQVF